MELFSGSILKVTNLLPQLLRELVSPQLWRVRSLQFRTPQHHCHGPGRLQTSSRYPAPLRSSPLLRLQTPGAAVQPRTRGGSPSLRVRWRQQLPRDVISCHVTSSVATWRHQTDTDELGGQWRSYTISDDKATGTESWHKLPGNWSTDLDSWTRMLE